MLANASISSHEIWLCSFVPHSPSIIFEGVTTAWDHWRSLSGNTLPGFKLPETELLCVSRLKTRIGQKQPHEPHCGICFKCSSVGSQVGYVHMDRPPLPCRSQVRWDEAGATPTTAGWAEAEK